MRNNSKKRIKLFFSKNKGYFASIKGYKIKDDAPKDAKEAFDKYMKILEKEFKEQENLILG